MASTCIKTTDQSLIPSSIKGTSSEHANEYASEIVPLVTPVSKAWDTIVEGENNASIVLGRKYNYHTVDTRVGMIDMCVGRVEDPSLSKDNPNQEVKYSYGISPKDSARIYMCQNDDVDSTFGLPTSAPSRRSAICLKADAIRIVSRDSAGGVKIMVQQDPDGQNSLTGDSIGTAGVELIAGGPMEPMVKADALADSLYQIVDFVKRLQNMFTNFHASQDAYNQQIATELKISPFYGAPVIQDPATPAQCAKTCIDGFNWVTCEGRYLRTLMSKYEMTNLGVTAATQSLVGAGKDKPTEKLFNAKFASPHHKLD